MNKLIKYLSLPVKIAVLLVIKIYQKTLSFDHGPLAKVFPFWGCRYHPSCSNYTYEAISSFGVIKGSYLGFKRILRCNPWNMGGHDPVPKKNIEK